MANHLPWANPNKCRVCDGLGIKVREVPSNRYKCGFVTEAYPSAAASNFAPSAADLDAVVAEKRAAEATSGASPFERGKSMHEIAEEARQKEEKDGEASLSTPAEITQEAIDQQNEHDRSTGNVDDQGRTPAEVVESETQL